MARCLYVPTAIGDKEGYHGFPALSEDVFSLSRGVQYWNGKLKDRGVEQEVIAVAQQEIVLAALDSA